MIVQHSEEVVSDSEACVVGIDAYKGGWVAVALRSGSSNAVTSTTASRLFSTTIPTLSSSQLNSNRSSRFRSAGSRCTSSQIRGTTAQQCLSHATAPCARGRELSGRAPRRP